MEKNNAQAYIAFDSVTIALENLEITSSHIIFGLEVSNSGSAPIRFGPHSFRNLTSDSYSQLDSATGFFVRNALTKKEVLEYFRKKRAGAQGAAIFFAVLGAGLIINDVVQDVKDTNKEEWTWEDAERSAARDAATAAGLMTVDILTDVAAIEHEQASTELRYLPLELMGEQTVEPDSVGRGKLYFPREMLYKYNRIEMMLEDNVLNFDFRKATMKERQYLDSLY